MYAQESRIHLGYNSQNGLGGGVPQQMWLEKKLQCEKWNVPSLKLQWNSME